jgi:hypothetical protein
MEKKQTAVEWLTEKISYQTSNGEVITYHKNIADLIQQAKQMEKEQIKEAYTDGQTISNAYQGASHYYNTEYGNG